MTFIEFSALFGWLFMLYLLYRGIDSVMPGLLTWEGIMGERGGRGNPNDKEVRPSADVRYDHILLHLERIEFEVCKLTSAVRTLAERITKGQEMASVQFEALKAEVERNTTVDESIKTLVDGLATQIESLKQDPAALQALADQLRSSSDSVADKVTANTPSA